MLHGGSLNLSPSPGYESNPGVLRQHAACHTGLQPCSVWHEPVSTPELSRCQARSPGERAAEQRGEGAWFSKWHGGTPSSRDKQHLFLSFTAGALFFPRCCLGDSWHTGTEKGELQDLWVREVISQLWCHPWHRASLAPPVGPFWGMNLPPIKTGIMLLA